MNIEDQERLWIWTRIACRADRGIDSILAWRPVNQIQDAVWHPLDDNITRGVLLRVWDEIKNRAKG